VRLSRGGGVAALAVALSIAGAALLPASASAAVTCTFAGGVLDVDVTAGSSQVSTRVQSGGDDIEVFDGTFGGTKITPCGVGGQPETGTTSSINVDDAAGLNTQFQFDLSNGALEPGTGGPAEGTGTPEIEVTINAGDGGDFLGITGTSGPDTYRFGALGANQVGANLNDDDDGNDVVVNNGERLRFITLGGGDDVGDASGGSEFTGPVPYNNLASAAVAMTGGGNNDVLTAGSGSSALVGDTGNNTITGGAGADELGGGTGTGTDVVDGGGGTDSASYQFATGGVHVDLRIAGPQDTVTSGSDTLSNLESIVGSQDPSAGDVLIGTDGPNGIFANAGDDTLMGLGGNDSLEGRAGNDTANYARGSSGPIALSLGTTAAQVTGGAGTDTLPDDPADPSTDPGVENIVGSPFGDHLTGNDGPNEITGGGGGDTISLLGGPDVFRVLDGVRDTVRCGDGADSGVADELGADAFPNGDCEAIDFAPRTTITDGPTGLTNDSTATFRFTSSEAGSSFQCRVDGGAFASCASPRTTAALADGDHAFAVRARDQALNLDLTPASRSFTVDTDPPDTVITKGPRKKTRKKKVTFEFSADEAGSSFECALDGAAFSPCQSPMTVRAKKKGKHSFQVRATDEAGNADETPAEHTWKRKKRKK
jgi:Ca2+-binding RTX toxin-like protein